MKEFLTLLFLLFSSAATEPQAPYPPSGWRPSGPAFELPQEKPEYLPPVDPRRPNLPDAARNPSEDDVTVQGLPTQEQLPLFQVSPISGQQYIGPAFRSDISDLNKSFQQYQFQKQQEKSRQFSTGSQQNLDTRIINPDGNYSPVTQDPIQSFPKASNFPTNVAITPRPRITVKSTEASTINTSDKAINPESESFNHGEIEDEQNPLPRDFDKTSLEVTKENIQEYPPEIFLSPLAQLQLQSQNAPLQQLGQIKSPLYFEATPQDGSARQISPGYDAKIHFAALSSILSARQNVEGPQLLLENQQELLRKPALLVNKLDQPFNLITPNTDQQLLTTAQYQPLVQSQALPQIPQSIIINTQPVPQIQPQINTQPRKEETENSNQNDNHEQYEFVQQQVFPYQLQPQQTFVPQQTYQPQEGFGQPQAYNPYQPQNVYQPTVQPQQVYQQYPYQPEPNSFYQPQQPAIVTQGQLVDLRNQDLFLQHQNIENSNLFGRQQTPQDALQSGLDINKQGNDIEESDDNEDGNNTETGDSSATAIATAFGSRTQPRMFPKYGAPIPKVRVNPDYQTTPDNSPQNEDATEADVNAESTPTPVVKGYPRKSAKLRSGRVRPLFTLDRSGRLVLARI